MKISRRFLALVLALCSSIAAAADVGRVVLAAGDTTALRQGQAVKLAFGAMVQDQDVLRTGAASNLQVRFVDDSYVSLRESSELRVDQFNFADGKGKESAAFSLLKGGLRAVTGLIGRQNHDDYKMVTPTATIGIRGTDYAATFCQGDCKNEDGTPARNGTYGRVIGQAGGTNRIEVSNEAGSRTLGINANFFVASRTSAIEQLLTSPLFVLSRLEARTHGGSKGSVGGNGAEQSTSGGAKGESRPNVYTVYTTLVPQLPICVQGNCVTGAPTDNNGLPKGPTSTTPSASPPASEILNAQGTTSVLQPPNGFVLVAPGMPGLQGQAIFDDNMLTGTFNGQNQLLSVTGGGLTASLAGGSIVDAGSVTISNGQTFVWGRWTGPTSVPLFNGSTYVQTTGVPLLFGTATGIQNGSSIVGKIGGVVTYNFVGGPSPVDGGGNVGSITSASNTINFTTLQQTYSLGISFPSIMVGASNTGPATFSLTGLGIPNPGNGGEFIGGLSGTCSGSGCFNPSAGGSFQTGLTGPNGYDFAVAAGIVFGTQAGEVAFLNGHLASSYTPGPLPQILTGQLAYAYPFPGYSAGGVFSLPTNSTVYSGSNPIAFNAGSSFGALGGGSIVETGSIGLADGGTMNWGRWSGATSITDPIIGTYTPASGVPFVVGNANVTLPTSGSFIYSYAGGPNPTNASGAVGSFSGGAFNVTFGSTSGSMSVSTPLVLSVGGLSYQLATCTSGCTFTNNPGIAGNMVLSGTCSGGAYCSASTPATANAAGIFVGPQGAGLAVAGNVNVPSQPTTVPVVTFAAGFKR